jgi:predicted Zn-dependent peptidase
VNSNRASSGKRLSVGTCASQAGCAAIDRLVCSPLTGDTSIRSRGVTVFQRNTLENGLRVLTADLPYAQSVAVMVMLSAGSRYETAETSGIAHFAEHMFFKGTERRPSARQIAGEIDAIGGEFNAFTGKENTTYYVKCAAEHRDVALDVLVDMLRNSRFADEEIEREKGVIVEEMNMYYDTPRDFIGGVYEELLWGEQPLGRDIIGRKETIRDATRDTFMGYLDRWYRPSRMVVGVAGRIGDGLLERVQELLGDAPDAETGEPEPTQPIANGRVQVAGKQSEQAHVCLGVHSLPLDHPDRYAIQLLATALGGGMSSRLFTEVRERRGLAYYVYGLNHSYTDAGTLYAQAGVDIGRIDDAVATIVAELRKIAAEPLPTDELEKARNFAKGRFVLQLESPQGLMMFGLRKEVLEGRLPDPDEVLGGLDAVTSDDVARLAGELILDDRLRLAVIGPFDDTARFEPLLDG